MGASSRAKGYMDVHCEITEEQKLTCQICGFVSKSPASLSGHVGAKHRVQMVDYVVKYFFNEIHPKCPICEQPTNYVNGKYSFKKYCKDHVKEAQSEWSKNNQTMDFGWKKGLTKYDHEGIMAQSEKMKGEGNPSFGKPFPFELTPELRSQFGKIKESKFNEIIQELEISKKIEIITTYENYTRLADSNIEYICLSCNTKKLERLDRLRRNICPCSDCRDYSLSEEVIEKLRQIHKLSKEEYQKRKVANESLLVLTPYSEYKKFNQKLLVECRTCQSQTTRTLLQLAKGTMCWKCNARSKEEKDIQKFLEENNVKFERNTRSIIHPYELDFYLPEHNFAIEFNGLYWHCELNKNKDYHKNKTEKCRDEDIQLFHIFEDEWRDKKEIVKSMILQRLKLSKIKIPARKCNIEELESKKAREFLNNSHIDGFTNSKKYFCLKYNEEVVCLLSVREPFHKSKYPNTLEISRFSSKINTIVQGGFSKLLKYVKEWAISNNCEKIITYADLRFGNGEVYDKNSDFQFLQETDINYWYTDYTQRYNRFKFRAQPNKSEKMVAEENGVYKIYGCSSKLFEMKLGV